MIKEKENTQPTPVVRDGIGTTSPQQKMEANMC